MLTCVTDIKHAFQALALDEHREAFSPTLWYLPQQEKANEELLKVKRKLVDDTAEAWHHAKCDKKVPLKDRLDLKAAYNAARRELDRLQEDSKEITSKLLQVWFPGVHINIGGGSSDSLKDEGDLEGAFQPGGMHVSSHFANSIRNGRHYLFLDA